MREPGRRVDDSRTETDVNSLPCSLARRGEFGDRHPDFAGVIEPSQVVRTDEREVSIMCTDLAMHVASE